MAYTKTPTQDTYQTKRVPMIFEREMRAWNDADTVAQNVLFELYKGEQTGDGYFEVIKRAGVQAVTDLPGLNPILGIYYSDSLNAIVWCTPNQITVLYNGALTNYAVPGMFLTDERVGFTDFLYQDGHVDIIVSDGVIIAAVNVVAASVAFTANPVPNVGSHRPYPVFLDGYLFVADQKGNIWNSNLNTPLVFSPSNFLTAEAYPDRIYALVRVNNYIVALGYTSIEYFYDAANLNGSPLARYDSGSKPIGILGAPAVIGDTIYFIGQKQKESFSFYALESFKLTKLSNNSIDRRIQHLSNQGAFLAVNAITLSGHSTVAISAWLSNGALLPVDLRPMQVYDLSNGMWSTFTFNLTSSAGPVKQTAVFGTGISSDPTISELSSGFILAFAQNVYKFSTEIYQDLGTFISAACRTRVQDFGTSRVKFLSRALFVGDYGAQVGGAILGLRLYFNDRQDQYGVYQVPLDDSKPVVYMRGAFRNLCLELIYEGNTPLRFKYLEIDYNQGDN